MNGTNGLNGDDKMAKKIKKLLVRQNFSIKDAMRQMDKNGEKILFVVNGKRELLGSVTDGDIRRWILSNGNLRDNVDQIYNRKPRFVKTDYDVKDVKKLMLKERIEQIPVIDEESQLRNVLLWEDVFSDQIAKKRGIHLPVLIMAGGRGTRLDPFTKILPKPLIPINGEAIIKIIMDKFASYGIDKFFVSINHKSHMIRAYFNEINPPYVIKYVTETKELGTAGCLGILRGKVKQSLMVTNCDIIIDHDYAEIVDFHEKNECDLTIVGSMRHYTIPYGICEITNGGSLKNLQEKPEYDFLINTGMYVLRSNVLRLIPKDRLFHMTELIRAAQRAGLKVQVFPIRARSWVDVGEWEEYRKAVKELGE
jgi:dTDP-glucose pyrophosphorylase/predicted transcriptional regulator